MLSNPRARSRPNHDHGWMAVLFIEEIVKRATVSIFLKQEDHPVTVGSRDTCAGSTATLPLADGLILCHLVHGGSHCRCHLPKP